MIRDESIHDNYKMIRDKLIPYMLHFSEEELDSIVEVFAIIRNILTKGGENACSLVYLLNLLGTLSNESMDDIMIKTKHLFDIFSEAQSIKAEDAKESIREAFCNNIVFENILKEDNDQESHGTFVLKF